MFDRLLRLVGRAIFIPRKIRSFVICKLTGDQRQLPGRQFEVTLFGSRYAGSTHSHIDWHVFFFGEYDPVGTNFLRTMANKTQEAIFIDIGANTGTHTLAMKDLCDQVHCFEPFPLVLRALRENLAANNIDNVTVYPFGLSSKSGKADFFENKEGNLGAGTFQTQDRKADQSLQLQNGDGFFVQHGIKGNIFKIDVEGHEIETLIGLKEQLANSRPIVLWEFSPLQHDLETLKLEDFFPEEYVTFRLSYAGRWTRTQPVLIKLSTLDRGNLVSVPKEKIELVQELIRPDA